MNFPRLAVAAVVAWLAQIAFGYLVYQGLVADQWTSPVFREALDVNFPLGLLASLAGLFLFSYMYAKGYEGGNGVQEGLRFGALVGLLLVCFGTIWGFVAMPLSAVLTLYLSVGIVLQLTLSGIVVGWVYRPTPSRSRRTP